MKGALSVVQSESFRRDFKRLPREIQLEALQCLLEIQTRDPLPASRRPHALVQRGMRPKIFSLDVTANKAYKLTFNLVGQSCVLLRVGTHKAIDRNPE